MSVKKLVTGFVVALAMVMVGRALGLFGPLGESVSVTQPMETVRSIEVELNDDYFDPKVITIPNGTSSTFILKNKGKKEHTFTVEKLGIDVEVQPGQEKNVNVKPTQSGTFELICRYHFQEGMVGEVIVN